jgi:EXLDI family protein
MPNKTIYVSDADLPMLEQATRIAGGLSPAVAAALRLYVQREGKTTMPDTDIVEVRITDGPITRTQRFRGRQLVTVSQRHDLRRVRYTVYVTAKEQYAVYVRDEPDWSRMSSDDHKTWQDPRTWDEDFYNEHGTSLNVFPDLDSMQGELPDDVVGAIAEAATRPAVEDLDI